MKTKTQKLTAGAFLCAIGVVILYLGAVFDVLDLSAVVITSVFVIFAVIELRGSYPWLIYIVTSLLAFLLLPNKLCAFEYACFGGIYPIFKAQFEKLHYIPCWLCKLSLFNTGILMLVLFTKYLFPIPDAGYDFTWILFLLGNLFFLIYDLALTKIIILYVIKIRKRLGFEDLFKGQFPPL